MKIRCQGCDTDIEVDEPSRHINCNYCDARLEVSTDGGFAHTEQLEKIARNSSRKAGDSTQIRLQNDLKLLDHDWDQLRIGLMLAEKHGHAPQPPMSKFQRAGIMLIALMILVPIMEALIPSHPIICGVLTLAFIVGAIYPKYGGYAQPPSYYEQLSDYQSRRRSLIARIEREKSD